MVMGSAVLGAVATLAAGRQPGTVLGLFIVVGTVVAALLVRPWAGRMVIPAPALCYVVAALVTGIVANRSADLSKTALAVGATQWIANGFFAMVLATVLAIALTAIRWFIWRRGRPAPRPAPRTPGGRRRASRTGPESYGPYPGGLPGGNQGWGDPDRPGPYNFSSGA